MWRDDNDDDARQNIRYGTLTSLARSGQPDTRTK